MMMFEELFHMIRTYGMEYVQNPEHRAQIMKITFVVMMKIIGMIRNRKKGHGHEHGHEDHIECHCHSCNVWKAKLDSAMRMNSSSSSETASHEEPPQRRTLRKRIANMLYKIGTGLRNRGL
jgi:aspartyl-tRNA synthetase